MESGGDEGVGCGGPEGLRILAVDDDWLIRMNTAALLEDLGHEVVEAASGKEALAMLADDPRLDLLITDQAMPQMTGVELAERARQIRPALPIVMATGYSDLPDGAATRAVKLAKPFNEAQLSHAIAQAVRRERAPQA